MADQEYSWIPPKYRVDDNGRMQFETAFPLNDYKSKWTDDERKRVESEGVYAFRGVVDRDRANFAKLQSGVQPIDDSDLWLWVNDRGLVPELDVMGMLGEFAVGAVKAGGRLAADYITPKRLYDQVTDLKGTTKQDMARLLASAEVGIQDYRMLASGARRLADKITNFETRTEKLEANRLFLKQASELQARVDANIKTVAEQFGVDPEKLSMEAEVLSEILDPFNLVPGGLALKAGAKVAARAGFKSTAGLVGLADDMGRELAEAYAERAVLEVAEKSTEAINQTIATLEKNLAEANTELAAKVSGAGLGRKVTGAGLAVAGAGVEKTGKGLERLQDLGSHMLDKISEGDSATRKAIGALATPATGAAIGGLVGGKEGAVAGGVLGAAPQILTHAGRDAKIIGKLWEVGETGLPITRAIRLNAEVSGLTKAVAKALDPFSVIIRPTAKGIAGAARGAATGGVIGAVYGYVASGGGVQPGGIAQGAAFGGTLGAMAGFAGVWHPLAKQGEDIRIRESQRKVVEDRFVPNSPSRLAWDKLDRGAQTAVASHLHAFPDLRLALINDQDGGFVNGTLFINPNKPESAIRSVVAHEIMHDMQARGYRKAIERIYIGNVAEGRPGLFTKLDENGKPVVSEERTADGQQKYETVDEFKGWKTRYENLVLQADKDRLTYSITDSDLAMELAAEQGVDFLMSQEYKDTLKPTLTSLGEGFYRSVLGRMGVTFDENGPVKGTQLFQQQVSKSPEMQSLLRGYAKAQAKSKGNIGYTDQDRVGTAVTRAQIRKNPELLKSLLGSDSINVDPATGLPEGIVLDGNGKWLIKDETKIYASPRTIRQKQREMAEAIRAQLDTLSDLDPDFVQRRDTEDGRTGYYGRVLPDAVLDALEAQGKWNPHQLAHMREINEALKRSDGTPFMHFYQSAQNRPIGGQKARHGAFAGAWHNEIPYGWMFDQNNNLLLTMLDPDTLVSNLDRAWLKNRADVKSTWSGNREQMVADAFKYLDNVSAGKPGETDIGVQKRDKINALLGLKGNRRGDANPFYSQLQPSAQSTIVRRRLDRINRASPTSGRKIAWGYKQYEQTKANFRPNSEVDSGGGSSEGRDMTQETMLGSRPMFFLDQDILDTLPPDHFQHEKSRWGVVRDPQDYYAHGTLRENAASIAENGIEARVGDFVKEAYGDSGMRLHKKVFMSPYSSKARDFSRPYETAINAMERYIAVKLGKAQSDVTEADFRAHGAIALVPKKEVAQALGAKTRSTGAAEPSDIVIGDTGAGLPAEWVLTGDSLIRWMNDPSQISSPDIRYRPGTPEFTEWFGDSKAVTPAGNPKRLYHGTGRDFDTFDPDREGTTRGGWDLRAMGVPTIFLTDNKKVAKGFAEGAEGPTERIIEAYASIQDPLVIETGGDPWFNYTDEIAKAYEDGKDGVILKGVVDGMWSDSIAKSNVYIAFKPEQVKYTNNRRPTQNPDMRYRPATEEDFTAANIGGILKKDNWAIITAQNPNAMKTGKRLNARLNKELEADLVRDKIPFIKAVGKYGNVEDVFIILDPDLDYNKAVGLARTYKQESVLTKDGLVYQDGSLVEATGITVHQTPPQDFFTTIPSTNPPVYFTADLDFDNKHSARSGAVQRIRGKGTLRKPAGLLKKEDFTAENLAPYIEQDLASELTLAKEHAALNDPGTNPNRPVEKAFRKALMQSLFTLGKPAKSTAGDLTAEYNAIVNDVVVRMADEITTPRTGQYPTVLSTRTTEAVSPGVFIPQNTKSPTVLENFPATLDALAAQFPNPLASNAEWEAWFASMTNSSDVVSAPTKLLDYVANPDQMAELLTGLTETQIAEAAHGLETARQVGEAYQAGKVDPSITGMYLVWGILSRGASAFPQESAFMNLWRGGLGGYVKSMMEGTANAQTKARLEATLKGMLPEGSPGHSTTHNVGAAAKTLLPVLSKIVDYGPHKGKTVGMALHELMSSPASATEIRREWQRMLGEDSAGIGNKVISFILLVTGRDAFVFDRIQTNHAWSGTPGVNVDRVYDGFPMAVVKSGKKRGTISYGGLAPMFDGIRGLAVYEGVERGLLEAVHEAYRLAGRSPEEATLGRWHWESWVATSVQEVGHRTLGAIADEIKGKSNPLPGTFVRQGKYDTWYYGAKYTATDDGGFAFFYPDSQGNRFFLTPEQFRAYIAELSSHAKKINVENRAVPYGFSPERAANETNRPWIEHPEVDRVNVDRILAKHGRAGPRANGARMATGS